ncbi:hypothetical protein VTL71DRAFT_16006 [Oculimacula yallundae]|uniref:DUF6594 domain-containing protein n=1 Tax=Oculimacula yallundae TaxID=86028 RepID=A0ABR4CD92_9HELO
MPTVATQTTPPTSTIFSAQPYLDFAILIDKYEELAIFRRFGDLNMLNLLSLQAELGHLQAEFMEICTKVKENRPEQRVRGYPATHSLPRQVVKEEGEEMVVARDERYIELQGQIRVKLKEYNSALLEAVQIRSLEPAEHADIEFLRAVLMTSTSGGRVENKDMSCWNWEHEHDLVLLTSQPERVSLIIRAIKRAFHSIYFKLWAYPRARVVDPSEEPQPIFTRVGTREMKRRNAFTSRLLMALFGGVALIVPTVIMAKNPSINFSLATTAVATVSFAVVLAFVARDSTGKDVLGITAAYTAVLVVFIGTSLAAPPTATAAASK